MEGDFLEILKGTSEHIQRL